MPEAKEGLIQASINVRWEHPNNGCIIRSRRRFIKEIFTAIGRDNTEAKRYAKILAENTLKICDECNADYILKG